MNMSDNTPGFDISKILLQLQKRFDTLSENLDNKTFSSFVNIRGRNNKKMEQFMDKIQVVLEEEIIKYMTDNQTKYFQALIKFFKNKHPDIILVWPEEIKDILKEVLTIR